MTTNAGGITIDPAGLSVAVSIKTLTGNFTTCFSDAFCTTPQSNPVAITSRTTFYVATPQRATISLKVNAVEIATITNTPLTVDFVAGHVQGISLAQVFLDDNLSTLALLFSPLAQNTLTVNPSGDTTGATDSSTIQAAIDAVAANATSNNRGKVRLGSGVFYLKLSINPLSTSVASAFRMRSLVHLEGQGPEATSLKLVDSAVVPSTLAPTGQVHIISNNASFVSGGLFDHSIMVSNFTLNGNALHQSSIMNGLIFNNVKNYRVEHVNVKNIWGNGSSPPGETFHFDANGSYRGRYVDCNAFSDDGSTNTATGFSSNVSSDISWTDCHAWDMGHGAGFTNWISSACHYANCTAKTNAIHGFNTERGEDIHYVNCTAGGRAPHTTDNLFFTDNQSFGNGSVGFAIQGSSNVHLTNCSGTYNTSGGLSVIKNTAISPDLNPDSIYVTNSDFSYNLAVGVSVSADATNVVIDPSTRSHNNTGGDWSIGTGAANEQYRVAAAPIDITVAQNNASGKREQVQGAATPYAYRFAHSDNNSNIVDILSLGLATDPFVQVPATGYWRFGAAGGLVIKSGANTPEGVVTAPVGSLFLRTNGGAGTTVYVKESGTGNTGWVAK